MVKEAKILGIIIAVTIVILIGAVMFLGKTPPNQTNIKVDDAKLINSDSFKSASDSAKVKVTLVEFADFQCPACRVAYPVVKSIKESYPETVNVVFRHFPLAQHKNAFAASLAAEAAGKQGKFYEMHDKLYETQIDWEDISNPKEKFLEYATELGLNVDQFKLDMEDKALSDKINRDYSEGVSIGINATPTFFMNGEKVTNLQNLNQLKSLVEQQLN